MDPASLLRQCEYRAAVAHRAMATTCFQASALSSSHQVPSAAVSRSQPLPHPALLSRRLPLEPRPDPPLAEVARLWSSSSKSQQDPGPRGTRKLGVDETSILQSNMDGQMCSFHACIGK